MKKESFFFSSQCVPKILITYFGASERQFISLLHSSAFFTLGTGSSCCSAAEPKPPEMAQRVCLHSPRGSSAGRTPWPCCGALCNSWLRPWPALPDSWRRSAASLEAGKERRRRDKCGRRERAEKKENARLIEADGGENFDLVKQVGGGGKTGRRGWQEGRRRMKRRIGSRNRRRRMKRRKR